MTGMIQTGTEAAAVPAEAATAPTETAPATLQPIASEPAPPAAAPGEPAPATDADAVPAEPQAQPHPKRTPRKTRQFVSDDTFDTWVAAREAERQASLAQAQAENQVTAGRGERRRLFALLRQAVSADEPAAVDADPLLDDTLARRVHEAPPAVRRTIEALLDLQLGRRRGRRAR